jgi:hypothetical protein
MELGPGAVSCTLVEGVVTCTLEPGAQLTININKIADKVKNRIFFISASPEPFK